MGNSALMNKILDTDMLQKLKINMWNGKSDDDLTKEYEEKKSKFIAEQMSTYEYSQNKALGQWLEIYPQEIASYKQNYTKLTAVGNQLIVDKINEIIEVVNKL